MMSDLGGHIVDYSKNTTCPRDMAIYLEALLQFNEEHPDEGELLIKYLKNTVFNDRIPHCYRKVLKWHTKSETGLHRAVIMMWGLFITPAILILFRCSVKMHQTVIMPTRYSSRFPV